MAEAKIKTKVAAAKKTDVKPVEAAEVKEEVKKAPVKAAAKKTTAKKTTVKKEAAVKKETAAKKAPAKKAEVTPTVHLQFNGKSYTTEDLVKIAKDVWKYDLNQKPEDFKTVELYVKPEEDIVYYVINQDVTGNFLI